MATRSAAQVYADLVAAGFPPAAATTMTAIAEAESSFNDAAVGDVALENGTWGPSYGLFQVRTLKAATGSGQDRDVSWLAASDANQAKAAFDISSGGRDLTPWSTFTSGAYQRFLGQAQSGAQQVAANPAAFVIPNPFDPFGTAPLIPVPSPGDIAGQLLGPGRDIALELVFVVLGLGLAFAGVARFGNRKQAPA